jgi:hypothetical protein
MDTATTGKSDNPLADPAMAAQNQESGATAGRGGGAKSESMPYTRQLCQLLSPRERVALVMLVLAVLCWIVLEATLSLPAYGAMGVPAEGGVAVAINEQPELEPEELHVDEPGDVEPITAVQELLNCTDYPCSNNTCSNNTNPVDDHVCSVGELYSDSASLEGSNDEMCCMRKCAQNIVGPDFPCSVDTCSNTHLKPEASRIFAYTQDSCCDEAMCAGNANSTMDCVCEAPAHLIPGAELQAQDSDTACCRYLRDADAEIIETFMCSSEIQEKVWQNGVKDTTRIARRSGQDEVESCVVGWTTGQPERACANAATSVGAKKSYWRNEWSSITSGDDVGECTCDEAECFISMMCAAFIRPCHVISCAISIFAK